MMLASDGVRLAVNASSFDRQLLGLTDYYSSRTMDLSLGSATAAAAAAAHHHHLSDCDRQEESLASSKSSHEQTGRSSRRKQSAPRSRLARQCDRCDFSSSNPTEFELHFKNEHSDEQVFNCEICSFSSSSALEYHFHLQSHNDMTSFRNHLALPETSTLTIDDDDDDDDEHQLNIDESKDQEHDQDQQMQIDEQSSDDDDLNSSSTDLNKKLNHSVTSTPSSNINNAPPAALPDRKRPYNVSVDPARYRRVTDPDDPSAVKFACSLCGNLYKWRKSLNKHWKEKHNDENPPPLDAPVTIRPSKSSQSKSLQTITSDSLPLNMKSSSSNVLPIPSSSTSSNVPSNAQHHSAFAFNPFAWLKLASSMPNAAAVAAAAFESTLNAPLDLRIKSNDDHHSALAAAAAAAVQQQQQQMNQMGHTNESDDDDGGRDSSDDTSSSSPQNSYGQKMFICSVCDQRFLSVETINEHFLKNHLNELENEIAGKSPPRNTNVAQQNEEWNLSDPNNPLKCIKCDFVGRWPTELQKHAASHSTSRPFKCLVCSLTYKWRWDLAKHWDRAHACSGKGVNLINPYKKRDRDQARSMMDLPSGVTMKSKTSTTMSADRQSISSANSNEHSTKNHLEQSDEEEQSQNSILSDNDDEPQQDLKRFKNEQEKNNLFLPPPPPPAVSSSAAAAAAFNPSMYFPPPFFPHHPMFSSFLNPSLLLQPKLNYSPRLPMNPTLDLFKQSSSGFVQQTASPNSSRSSSSSSSSPRPSSPLQNHQRRQAVAAMLAVAAGHSASTNPSIRPPSQQGQTSMTTPTRRIEKEERNFQCRWCDYRGRWRSELIQHMRCHHARDKPYHCSACPYASSWKWDVQKHVKKQHAHNTARIVELPDKYLFQTTLKAKYEGTDDRNLAPPPLTEDDYSFFGADVQEKLSSMKYTRDRTLSCQQCPFAANSMAELRRHLIVHSTESPYHCFNCNYKSKWKCDVKKHMRICNHHGPVLVGRKAMAKVMESLGLVISNNNQRAMATEKVNEEDDDEDEIIVDENQAEEEEEEEREPEEQEDGTEEKDKTISNNSRASNHHLRCRQCDYEADDLSDLLIHRKAHASMKSNKNDTDRKHNSDIENDDQEQIHPTEPSNLDNEQMFNYELQWLENNPAMKRFTTVHEKTQSILYQCSKCHFQINTHQNFLNHIDHHHSELVEDHL